MRKLGIKIVVVGQLVSKRHMSSSDLISRILKSWWLTMWGVEWVLCRSDYKHLRQRLLAEINLYQFCESERYETSDWALRVVITAHALEKHGEMTTASLLTRLPRWLGHWNSLNWLNGWSMGKDFQWILQGWLYKQKKNCKKVEV